MKRGVRIERAGREVEEMIGYAIPETAYRHYAGAPVNGIYAAASG